MLRRLTTPVALAAVLAAALPAPAAAQAVGPAGLPDCGEMADALPRAAQSWAGRRPCPPRVTRTYAPKHAGLAYEVLKAEDEVCFVPDEAFRELDSLIDATIKRAGKVSKDEAGLTRLGKAFAEELIARGHHLLVPTVNLGDALLERRRTDGSRMKIVDCDTGAMILITIARQLGFEAALVEMVTRGGDDHNYVRYALPGRALNWDVNGVSACATPADGPPWHNTPMSDENVMGYVVRLRAWNWQRFDRMDLAMADWRRAADLWPGHPAAANEFAWTVAAGDYPGREAWKADAVVLAQRAVALRRDSSHLDTLACAYAFAGDFARAREAEQDALNELPERDGSRSEYEARAELFADGRDCSGQRTDWPTPDFDPNVAMRRSDPVSGGPR